MFLCVFAAQSGFARDPEIEIRRNVPGTLLYPMKGHTPLGIHRGTPYWLEVLTGGKTKFSLPRDLAVTRLKSTDKESDPWDDILVSVYGINSGRGEIIYNVGNTRLKVFGKEGTRPGEFKNPVGIAASPDGRVLVADTGNNRVQELYDDGKGLKFVKILYPANSPLPNPTTPSFPAGGFVGQAPPPEGGREFNPNYLALDAAGGVFVSDTGNGRLIHLDKDGKNLKVLWKGSGKPLGVAYAEAALEWYFPENPALFLVVEGEGEWRLLRLEPDSGKVLRSTVLPKEGGPYAAMELDYQGHAWVVDSGLCRILKYSPDLEFLDAVGSKGSGDYRFESPAGLAIWRRFGQVFVSEKEGAHYFWVGADALNPKIEFSKDQKQAVISFRLTERALVRADWVKGEGKKQTVVSALALTEMLEGEQKLVVSAPPESPPSEATAGTGTKIVPVPTGQGFTAGTGTKGVPVPTGRERGRVDGWSLRLRVMATYSSRERMEKEVLVPMGDEKVAN